MTPKQIAERILELDGKSTRSWLYEKQPQEPFNDSQGRKITPYKHLLINYDGDFDCPEIIAEVKTQVKGKYENAEMFTGFRNLAPQLAREYLKLREHLDNAGASVKHEENPK